MRHTVVISALVALTTAALTVFAIEFSGLRPSVSSAQDGVPAGAEGEIKGDIDCNLGIEAVDALKLLQDIAAFDYTQNDPCTEVGTLIPAGEPIPGPQGPQGPQGEPGISGYEVVEHEIDLSGEGGAVATIPCPDDKVALGGGVSLVLGGYDNSEVFFRDINGPSDDGHGWEVHLGNSGGTPRTFIIRVICAAVAE